MARNILTNLDLNYNELLKARAEILSSDPPVSDSKEGQIIYNSTEKRFKYFNGTNWTSVGDSDITVTAAGDGVVSLTGSGGVNTVNISASHSQDGANATKGATADLTINSSNKSGSIKVPKVVVDKYGHTTGLTEQTLSITLPNDVVNTDSTKIKVGSTTITADHTLDQVVEIKGSGKVSVSGNTTDKSITITGAQTTLEDLGLTDIDTIRSNATKGANHADVKSGNPHSVTKSDIGLSNVTNDKQVKALSTSTTDHIVTFGGTDGATIKDSGKSISNLVTAEEFDELENSVVKNITLGSKNFTVASNTATLSAADGRTALGLGAAATKGVSTSVTSGDANLITSGAVFTAIDNLPEPMVFKGTLGTGGTITSLPTAAAGNEGWTYKVITAGTYAGVAAKVGDTFISTGTKWELIPSGDEPSGTVTNVATSGPITGGPITTTGTIGHATSGVTAGTYNSVTVDTYGHVTGGTSQAYAKKYTGTITFGTSDTYKTVTHNLNARPIAVQVYDGNWQEVLMDVELTSVNAVKLSVAKAPSTSTVYNVVCIG